MNLEVPRDLIHIRPLSGGCINAVWEVTDGKGQAYCLKQNAHMAEPFFAAEARGLQLLADTHTLPVPQVVGYGSADTNMGGGSYLLLEYIAPGKPQPNYWALLGEGLAALHRHTAPHYGLDHDNYIGSLPQANTPHTDWATFFVTQRLEPQMQAAAGHFSAGFLRQMLRLYERLPAWMPDEPPSLLHGDLWSGNVHTTPQGAPCLIDPAVYYGNREAELAFTHLFGGFSPVFYAEYTRAWPLQPDFAARRDLYNLYPLLVHANLFGGGYVRQVTDIVSRYMG